MESDGVLAEISHDAFKSCLDAAIEDVILNNEKAHEVHSTFICIPTKFSLETHYKYRLRGQEARWEDST